MATVDIEQAIEGLLDVFFPRQKGREGAMRRKGLVLWISLGEFLVCLELTDAISYK